MNGLIFDIQRFSVHDGPGIRTTVFMKGCPLHCKWCHNPEGLSFSKQLQFHSELCIGCNRCNNHNIHFASNCPTGALKIVGEEISTESLLKEILKDKIYYNNDGGVTFSGGECLMQADFVCEMLKLCKNEGLTTAIDTCGAVPFEKIEKTIPYTDTYLYDIKAWNSDIHKKYTGKGNEQILDNLIKLDSYNKDIYIRIPIIPDVNDDIIQMQAIATFLSKLNNIKNVTLMPYHTLGKSKYELMNMQCDYNTTKTISKEKINQFKTIFNSYKVITEE